ncbi:ferredoxin [Nocardia sp. NPDC058640]|uniref:ferredoxin n=1 Tax=Nocardia sp. NPDC058640 TaxID=3346571 RepID=UPI00364880D4
MYWDPIPVIAASEGATYDNTRDFLMEAPASFLLGKWANRDWRNVPGPFYGAGTDNCLTGRFTAPAHIVYDDDYYEVIYRQPGNPRETYVLLEAMRQDPYSCYAADGDKHWTLPLIRDWWADRGRLAEWINQAIASQPTGEHEEDFRGLHAYDTYLTNGLETYLVEYAFWLDNGRPATPDEARPSLNH